MDRDVIIACDFNNEKTFREFLDRFKNEPNKPFLKIGMELFYSTGINFVKNLKKEGYKIFLDLKMHDIPTTVKKSIKALKCTEIDIINVHASGGFKMMKAAREAVEDWKNCPKIIAVTQLTSTSTKVMNDELQILGSVEESVKKFASLSKKAGLDGVVCSVFEANAMAEMGMISITPGIRMEYDNTDDQVRVATPAMAKKLKSTYIVVGRAITGANNPVSAYNKCKGEFM